MEKEIRPYEKIPLTELLRFVNKSIAEGSDYFSLEIDDVYGGEEYKLKTY